MSRDWTKGLGPPCPACGDTRSSRLANGWSEPGDDYLRYKRCNTCGSKFTTVEVLVPEGASFYRLDYHSREQRRAWWRAHKAKTTVHRAGGAPSDQLFVKVHVTRVDRRALVCLRGHPFTPANTITRANGHRRCRLCQQINNHSYFLRRRSA